MKKFLAVTTLAAGLAAFPALGASEVNVSLGLAEKGAPLAARGYDVVSYFTDGRPVPGVSAFAAVYAGAAWRFASEEHLRIFQRDPEKYVPQYGGFCAYGTSVGKKFDGDPHVFKIVGGRLFFNLNEKVQTTWEEDIPGNVSRADGNWKRIASKRPDEL